MRPEDALGIEDAQVGVEAIRASGMVAVGVGAVTGADLIVRSTEGLTLDALRAAFARARSRPDTRHEPEPGPGLAEDEAADTVAGTSGTG